jgi:hypothetical protein
MIGRTGLPTPRGGYGLVDGTREEIEAMLAAQLVANEALAMEILCRAIL